MGRIQSCILAPDQVQVVTVGSDHRISFWDLREQSPLQVIPDAHQDEAKCSTMSPTRGIFATGGIDKVVRLWEFSTGKLLTEVMAHSSAVLSMAFSANGDHLVTTGEDGMIAVWAVPN